MFGLGKDAVPALGLDLGDDAVRIAAIRPASGNSATQATTSAPVGAFSSLFRSSAARACKPGKAECCHQLLAYADEPLSADSLSDGRVRDVAGVAHAVRRAWERLDVETREICMALPSGLCMQRILEVDVGLPALELEALVELEAARVIPYPLEEVALDHRPLMTRDDARESGADRVPVLMVAARRDYLEERLAVVRAAGLRCSILDVDGQVFRLGQGWVPDPLSDAEPDAQAHARMKAVALVDLGRQRLTLHVFEPDGKIYSREQHLDAASPQSAASDPLGAQASRDVHGLPDNAVLDMGLQAETSLDREMLAPPMTDAPPWVDQSVGLHSPQERLVDEILLALRFYAANQDNHPLQRLLLSGDADRFPDLADRLSVRLEYPVQMADPSEGLMIPAAVSTQALRERPVRGLLACALALRGLDDRRWH